MSPASERPAAFLDRDGTIIVEREYLADPEGVVLLAGAAHALARLRAAGHALVIVTNQSGIARGLYDEANFRRVQARVEALLAAEGVVVDGVYHCPHHPSLNGPCECRKPGTLLFRRAAADLGLDLRRSAFIGDRRGDVEPARALGGRGFLVRTGYGTREEPLVGGHVEVVEDLEEAVTRLLAEDAPASKQGPPSGPKG